MTKFGHQGNLGDIMGTQMDNFDFARLGQNGFVSAEDALTLRRHIFKDDIVSKEDMDALLALGERAPDGDPEWRELFGEVVADYYLREEIPRGFLTEGEFLELKTRVTQYSDTVTPLVLWMLVDLMDKATATPPAMSQFIADQIKKVMIDDKNDPHLGAHDVALIRKYLFANGGDQNVAISKREASLLFDLNDLTICRLNDASWSDLFVKSIANHLMAHIGYQAPSREEALRQYQWLSDHSTDIQGFFSRMISGGLTSVRNLYREVDHGPTENTYDQILASRADRIRDAEVITDTEADWLADRIGRDGIFDDNERAVIAYMKQLDAELPQRLRELVADNAA